jgi:hydroxymethylglutaryl-CoA lyase
MWSVNLKRSVTCNNSFKADAGDERNMMPRKINIVEVGPRDGLQSEPEILSTASKVEFITRAIDAGVTRLEVASFVHPKRVPQMADAEALLAELPLSDDVSYIGLIMNERGLDRALETPVHEVGMVVVSTDSYNQRNQGVPTAESIDAWVKIAARAKANGKIANVMISSAFGCPFEGEVSTDRIVEIAKRVTEAEPAELGIADSIGVAVPNQITDLLGRLQNELGPIPLRCHLHNTRNTGLANAQAAIDSGAVSIDASIGGIGGCPFAPAATGNIPTDDLLYMLSRSGIDTGLSLEKIIATSEWLEQVLGRGVPAMLPKAGIFPSVVKGAR